MLKRSPKIFLKRMADKFKILALDLHNTIYDEVIEYGQAINAAISALPAPREVLYAELSNAHAELGSDWDDDVWAMLPSLKNIKPEIIENAIALRHAKSRELTLSGAYPKAVETLKTLKTSGVYIYLVTEAAADVGVQAVSWLGLAGVIDGVYTYPSRKSPAVLENTFHKPFALGKDGLHLKKPAAELLYNVAADHVAKHGGTIKDVLDTLLYVGDSKFKDGFLARNAGVKFGLAAYGKKVKPGAEKLFSQSKDILYAVTGWDKETLKLTQEAGHSEAVNSLKPDYIFENSLAECLPLFINN